MVASQYGAVASMQKLLDLGCDPDLLSNGCRSCCCSNAGKPALLLAIYSEVLPAVHMLLATTTQGLKSCITQLAKSTALPMSDEIKHWRKNQKLFRIVFGRI